MSSPEENPTPRQGTNSLPVSGQAGQNQTSRSRGNSLPGSGQAGQNQTSRSRGNPLPGSGQAGQNQTSRSRGNPLPGSGQAGQNQTSSYSETSVPFQGNSNPFSSKALNLDPTSVGVSQQAPAQRKLRQDHRTGTSNSKYNNIRLSTARENSARQAEPKATYPWAASPSSKRTRSTIEDGNEIPAAKRMAKSIRKGTSPGLSMLTHEQLLIRAQYLQDENESLQDQLNDERKVSNTVHAELSISLQNSRSALERASNQVQSIDAMLEKEKQEKEAVIQEVRIAMGEFSKLGCQITDGTLAFQERFRETSPDANYNLLQRKPGYRANRADDIPEPSHEHRNGRKVISSKDMASVYKEGIALQGPELQGRLVFGTNTAEDIPMVNRTKREEQIVQKPRAEGATAQEVTHTQSLGPTADNRSYSEATQRGPRALTFSELMDQASKRPKKDDDASSSEWTSPAASVDSRAGAKIDHLALLSERVRQRKERQAENADALKEASAVLGTAAVQEQTTT